MSNSEENQNVYFPENASTRERLLFATEYLLAKYGYEATTTRMIANTAGVTLSAINFHFGNKENLVEETIRNAANSLASIYSKFADKANKFFESDEVTEEKAWDLIDEFLYTRLKSAMVKEYSWKFVGLAERENGLPESSKGILAKVAVDYSESILARLILVVSEKKDPFLATMLARTICASIMTYTEKPMLVECLSNTMDVDSTDHKKVIQYLHDIFMNCIKASV